MFLLFLGKPAACLPYSESTKHTQGQDEREVLTSLESWWLWWIMLAVES